MKKAVLLFLLTFLLDGIFAQPALQQIANTERKQFSSRQSLPQTLAIDNSDFIYQRCEWQADPAVNFIAGKITTYFIPRNTITLLEFDLSDSLVTDSVLFHGTSISFTQQPGDILQISFPSSLPQNVTDSVAVFYHGAPPHPPGFGSFTTSTHGANNTPVLWTLSEPYGAKDWWPCKQNLSDKIDSVDIIVTCPAAYRAASNGILLSEIISGPNKICTWKHRHPVAAYLVCFAVSDYAVYTNLVPFNGDTVKVINYVYPEDSLNASYVTPDIIPQMQLYDTLFGEYPFADEKYGHTECGFGGGMEHQTMTFVGGFSYELLSHELAHHWFGDKVTCASWHDIWLNEGFATYLSGLCYEHYTPNQYWMPFKAGRINYITSLPDGSVYCSDTTDINRIFDDRLSYAKGAMVLHTLRWVIGDSAWYASINSYLNDPALAYNFATTADLQQHLEAASGQSLGWYFADWYYGQGYPSYAISWDEDANNLATFTVNQSQSDPSVSFFELPLPIRFKNSTQDTTIRVNHTFSGQSFSVQLSFHADSLLFDPELWIISANNTVSSVQQLSVDASVSIYPNPANEQLFIYSGNANTGKGTMKIYDVSGRLVQENELQFNGTNSQQSVSIAGLNSGAYLVVIETAQGNVTERFVKE